MSIRRLLMLLVLLVFAERVYSQLQQNSSLSDETIWFVLEGGSKAQMPFVPILKVTGHVIQGVPESCEGPDGRDASYNNFESHYLRPGRSYQALFGGADAGTITVNEADPNFGRGYGEYQGNAPIRGRISGLAVSINRKSKSQSSRKPATSAQQAAAKVLATNLLKKAGIASELLPKIKVKNVTLSSFLPLPEQELLASFSVEDSEGNEHAVFFIAGLQGDALVPEFTWVHVTKTEAAVQVMTFVDQADLFEGGREEVIAEISYYENWSYLVLKRADNENKWVKIFETDVLGCE